MLKFVPIDEGKRYKVLRNKIELKLLPAKEKYPNLYMDDAWCLMLTREAISLINQSNNIQLTAKEENQLFNFYRYGKTNPSKTNKLIMKIEETEIKLKALKQQLEKELKDDNK